MAITIDGNTGVSKVQDGVIVQADLASGVAGTGPAFGAFQSSAQTLSSSTDTKLTFTTEEFDTNNNFSSSTFTPTVAGYYLVNATFGASSIYTTGVCSIRKNGVNYKNGALNAGAPAGTSNGWSVSSLVFCNGSTDYIEIYGLMIMGQTTAVGIASTYFNACMVRAA